MNSTPNSVAGGLLLAGILALPALAQNPSPDLQGPVLNQRAPLVQAQPMQMSQQQELAGGAARLGDSLPSALTPVHTAADDEGQRYGIWAAGDTYKASFHDGMTFVPYLGADYPNNQPLSWKTTSTKVGNTELIESGIAPAHHQQDYRYEYRFGGVTEAYDVRAGGLEQTFIINQLPAAGDLVITGALTTQLQAQNVAPAHQALQFVDDQGHPILNYGAAVAFDAIGNTVPVSTGFHDGAVTLTVPGAWLQQASLPVVVDPLLSRVQVAFWGSATYGTVGEVDIARDDEAISDNVMITYTRRASATDTDVWARLQDDDFTGTSIVYSDITTSWDTNETSCAFVGGADRWAVVFKRYFRNNPTRVSQLRCHVHDSGDTVLSTNYISLIPGIGNNDWRPDVGGSESFASGNKAIVVFQREDNSSNSNHFAGTATSQVRGALIDMTTTNGTFGTAFPIYGASTWDTERPSVNQVAAGGASYSWICVCQTYNNGIAGDDWDVVGKRIDQTGSISTGLFISDFALQGTEHQLGPVVEGRNGRYLVSFGTTDLAGTPFKTGLVPGKKLHAERFDWPNGFASPIGDKPPMQIRSNNDRRWEMTGIAYDTDDASHFAVGFRAVSPGVPAAYFARVGYNGVVTEGGSGGSSLLYYAANDTPTMVSCVYDNDHDDFLFAYGVNDGTTTLPVFGHTLEYVTPPAKSVVGPACGSATIDWAGSQQIGSEINRIVVDNGNAAVGHFLIVSLGTANTPIIDPNVFPGCRLLVQATGPNYLGTMPFQFGPIATWRLALPEWLDPMTFHFQDWLFDGTLFYNTPRLSVPVIK